jgi:hypothetical protein
MNILKAFGLCLCARAMTYIGVRTGAVLQGVGVGGGVEHPHSSANRQIIISVGKTGLTKDNH